MTEVEGIDPVDIWSNTLSQKHLAEVAMIVLKVDLQVKPGMGEKCKELIRHLHEHSRKEPGCVQYVGHQSTEDPRKFMFYEVYKDEAALQAHRDSAHFKQYVIGGLDGIMENRTRMLYREVE
jgi:(4S)-4-hydroxy-5-phosphonooxypentane-2,3-dione isomerase